jgi:hypothetical protein
MSDDSPQVTGHHAIARLLEQPEPIRDALAVFYRSASLENIRLHWIFPRQGNNSIDGPLESIQLTCMIKDEVTGISIAWTHLALSAAAARRNDHGHDWSSALKEQFVPGELREPVQALAAMGYRLDKKSCCEFGLHLKLICGHASETAGEPFGISIQIDQGAWLSGHPSPERKPFVCVQF